MSPVENSIVTLRVVSPCSHGIAHDIRELPLGCSFSTRKCLNSKGVPKNHNVTVEAYPEEVRRR